MGGRAWLWRWRRNPLRRRTDIVEAWLGLTAGVAIAVGAPLVGTVTTAGAAGMLLRPGEDLHPAIAVLTEPAPDESALATARSAVASSAGPRVPVTVRWQDGGTERTGDARVDPGTEAGAPVTIWLDERGGLRPAPVTPAEAWTGAATLGVSAAAGVCLVVAGVHGGLRGRRNARRHARWDQEWAEVAPHWCGRV